MRACYDLATSHASGVDERGKATKSNPTQSTAVEVLEALGRALLCDHTQATAEVLATFPEYVEGLLSRDESLTADQQFQKISSTENSKLGKHWSEIESTLAARCVKRRLGVTMGGRFGQMPIGTKRNDLVCVLIGGEVPFVIRPTHYNAGATSYHLVGDCYVNGFMNGEALEAKEHVTTEIQLV